MLVRLFYFTFVFNFVISFQVEARLPNDSDLAAPSVEENSQLSASLTSCAKALSLSHGINKSLAKGLCRTLASSADDQGISIDEEVASRHGRCMAARMNAGIDRFRAGGMCARFRRASVQPAEEDTRSAEILPAAEEEQNSIS